MKTNVIKFPFRFADQYNSITCVYRLSVGDHFMVLGCKRLVKRAYQHSEEIERRLRLGVKEGDIYARLIPFIREQDIREFVIELLFEVPLESSLPLYEQRLLDLVRDHPKCLNTSFTAQARTYQQKTDTQKPVTPGDQEPIVTAGVVDPIIYQPKTPQQDPAPPTAGTNPLLDALNHIKAMYGK